MLAEAFAAQGRGEVATRMLTASDDIRLETGIQRMISGRARYAKLRDDLNLEQLTTNGGHVQIIEEALSAPGARA
jgi:hypothetical protein